MATGLAARIKDIFGITAQLVGGHNGIYETSINGQVVVTNQGKCSSISSDEAILQEIRKYQSPLPGKEKNIVKSVFPMMKC
jgi:hypothetical protein